jgi:ABC-type phosphate transport system substrate-binding protein
MRIIMSTMLVAVTAAMLLASSLAVLAQEDGQYASEVQPDPATVQPTITDSTTKTPAPTDPATVQPTTTIICAPWSKEWDVSEGQWVSDWYRWCVDSSVYNPMVESSWYREWGSREYGGQVNLCPESGRCTVSPGGGVQMIKGN